METFNLYLSERFGSIDGFKAGKYYHPNAAILYSDTQYNDSKYFDTINTLGKGSISIDTVKLNPDMGYVKWTFKSEDGNDVIKASEFYVFRDGKIFRQTVTLSKDMDLKILNQ